MNKKAQIGTLQSIIVTLVVIGFLIGIGLLLLREFTTQIDEETATITNETIAGITNSSTIGNYSDYNYTTTGINCYNTFALSVMHNATSGVVVPTTNYSYDTNGKVWIVEPSGYNDQDVNISYTYKYGNEACGGVESTIEATETIPAWLTIVVLLLIVGILLAIVFRVLPTATGKTGGGLTAEV